MIVMERHEHHNATKGLANLSIEDTASTGSPNDSYSLPPTPPGPTNAHPVAPEHRPGPTNGSFPYAAYSGQPRAMVGPGIVAPRQLPPYVCTTSPAKAAAQKAARGDASGGGGGGGSSTGWGGMPLSPHGPTPAAPGEGDQPSTFTDKDGAGGGGSGGVSATGTASEPGTASEGGAAGASPSSRRRSTRGPGGGVARSPCAFFLKTGSCAYGDRCKFDHPYDKAPKVVYNSMGLPMRPDEPPCAFYMKHAHCAFGHTCKYHHPELAARAAGPSPPPGGATAAQPSPQGLPPPQMVAFTQGHAMPHPYFAAVAMQFQQMAAAAGGRLPDGAAVPHPMAFAFYRGGVPAGAYPPGLGPHQLPPGTAYVYSPAPGGVMPPSGRDGDGGRPRSGQQRGGGGGGGRSFHASPHTLSASQSRHDSGVSPLGSPRSSPRPAPQASAAAAMGLPVYTPKPLMVFNSPGKPDLAAADSD